VNLIRNAARDLGFLLPDDDAIIIQSAAENPLWPSRCRERAPWLSND
jgi:hypothetical protein